MRGHVQAWEGFIAFCRSVFYMENYIENGLTYTNSENSLFTGVFYIVFAKKEKGEKTHESS